MKMKEVQGLQFCSFEGCSPQQQQFLHQVLHQECKAVELYWNRRPTSTRTPVLNGYVPASSDYPALGSEPASPPQPAWVQQSGQPAGCPDVAVGAGGAPGLSAVPVTKATSWPANAASAPEFVPSRRPTDDCSTYMPPPPPEAQSDAAAAPSRLAPAPDAVSSYMPPAPPGIRTSPGRVVVSAKGYFTDSTDLTPEESPSVASESPTGAQTPQTPAVGAHIPAMGAQTPADGDLSQPSASDLNAKKYERRNKKKRMPRPAGDTSVSSTSAGPPPSIDNEPVEAPVRPAGFSQPPVCDDRTSAGSQPTASSTHVIADSGPPTSQPAPCPATPTPTVQSSPRPASPQKTEPVLVTSSNAPDIDSTFKDNQNFPALERTCRGGLSPSATSPLATNQTLHKSHDSSLPSPASELGAPQPAENKGVWGSKPSGGWAALFKDESSAGNNTNRRVTPQRETTPPEKAATPVVQPVTAAQDSSAKRLGGLLEKYVLCYNSVSLMPRGLINRGNWCYINGTLQALLACPPFYHLLKSLPAFPALERGPTSTPLMDCLIEFANEFQPYVEPTKPVEKLPVRPEPGNKKKGGQDIYSGIPFEPKNVYNMLQVIKSESEFKHGRQEDAEEFLSVVLNGIHDEMVATINLHKNPEGAEKPATNGEVKPEAADVAEEEEEGDEDQWEQVGPKNKSVVTRAANCVDSPISAIFRGQIRSILHQPGLKESATLQPFFTLQLDIHHEGVWSVQDALEQLVSKESLQGFTCPKTKQEVEATRRITLETLPPVLVLHLKWFVYDKSGGSQKQLKKVEFTETLDISKDLLSPNVKNKLHPNQRSYKMFAVVNHHGPRAVGGHYTTDIFHPGIKSWLHCDDSNIRPIPLPQVLKYNQPKVPYLIYYHRADLV